MIDLYLVSDVRLYRDALAETLHRDGRLRLRGAAGSIAELRAQLETGASCVVLLDMALPDSLEGVRSLAACGRAVKVVALGIAETRDEVVSCAEAGIRGFVCRHSSLEDLVAAVESADRGELHCSPRIAAALLESVARLAHPEAAADDEIHLTVRELEIAVLLEQGLGNREIAGSLHIAVATVKVHVHHILEKLGSCRRGEAAAKLRRSGLLPPLRLRLLPSPR